MAFELGVIPRWAFAEKTGRWNVGGNLHFYRAEAKDEEKTVYQDVNGLIPYPNPIVLDSIGSVGAIYFNNDEPYYITLNDAQDTQPPIWEFDNYVPTTAGGGGTPGGTEIDYTNFVMNGQFRFFFANPITSLTASEIEIAPYWFFDKSNTTGTDTIEFLPFLLGVTDPPYSPTYYCRYNCTNVPTGETYKDFYIKIKDVNAFQNQFITISIEQRGSNPVQLFEFRYLQHFGTGGTPSADVVGAIGAYNIASAWTKTSDTTTLPTIGGKIIGTNKDDYLAIIIRLPLNVVSQFDFTNFQINLGDKILDYEFQTYDKAKIEERSINYPIYRDINGLVTEQNVSDPTTLITINEGVCADSTGYDLFRVRAALTKDVTTTWVEGDLVGGLADGLTITADTWYHNFLLFSPNGKIDSGTDTSLTAANLLADSAVQAAGYRLYRRVSSFRTLTGSALIKSYFQKHDTFLFDEPDNYASITMLAGTASQNFVLDVPPGFSVEAIITFSGLHQRIINAFPPFVTDSIPAAGASPLYTYFINDINPSRGGGKYYIITDDSQQIRQNRGSTAGNTTFEYVTLGWKDWRRD